MEALEFQTDNGAIRLHTIKTWPEYFNAVVNPDPRLRKTVEVRKNDRDYRVGDYLCLVEYDPKTGEYRRTAYRLVTHILDKPPYAPKGYVIMSIMDEAPSIKGAE